MANIEASSTVWIGFELGLETVRSRVVLPFRLLEWRLGLDSLRQLGYRKRLVSHSLQFPLLRASTLRLGTAGVVNSTVGECFRYRSANHFVLAGSFIGHSSHWFFPTPMQ